MQPPGRPPRPTLPAAPGRLAAGACGIAVNNAVDIATDLREILNQLEARLEAMEAEGHRFLNIAEDPALAESLKAYLAALPAVSHPSSAGPAAEEPRREGAPHAGRAAAVAAKLRGGGAAEPPSQAAAPPGVVEGAPAGEDTDPADIKTLESLAFRFRNCMACELGATRNRLVFGAGSGRAAIMFIGEGPGAEEDQQGLPFVGRAGALLAGLVNALGLTREDVYITNVVKCRPPGNRNPEPGEAAACRPILERQIELLHPKVIVTLGNVPLKALKPSAAGITRERGSTFSYRDCTVLPTFHPSYLLRDPDAIEPCWADFKQAFQLAYSPGGEAVC